MKTRDILLVEDDQAIRELLKQALEQEWLGIQVKTMSNGYEAVSYLQTCNLGGDNLPDLVITDMVMPIINGIDLIHFIKNSSHFKDIPIMGMSAQRLDKSLEKYNLKFFLKPIDLEVFLEGIPEYLTEIQQRNPDMREIQISF